MFGDPPPEWPQEFAFVVVPEFSMIALTSAIEPLRHANQTTEKDLYRWGVHSENGDAVTASNGLSVGVQGDLASVGPHATVVVCGGPNIERHGSSKLLTWLRKTARHGRDVGALCTATHLLAQAGVLNGRRCTIHWENVEGFAENFPDLELTGRLFEVDNDRFTCAGETAAIDMMVTMIAAQHGDALGTLVADQVLHSPVRDATHGQRASLTTRIGARHPKLVSAIERMEANVETPLSPDELARYCGLSRRQLERLFQKHLDASPQRYYRQLRLDRARSFLLQTNMSVTAVAVACGFSSPSHFTKCYKAKFDRSPYQDRGIPARP